MRWLRAIKSFLLEHQGILLLLYVDVPLSGFFSQGTRNIRLLVRGLGDSDGIAVSIGKYHSGQALLMSYDYY